MSLYWILFIQYQVVSNLYPDYLTHIKEIMNFIQIIVNFRFRIKELHFRKDFFYKSQDSCIKPLFY